MRGEEEAIRYPLAGTTSSKPSPKAPHFKERGIAKNYFFLSADSRLTLPTGGSMLVVGAV